MLGALQRVFEQLEYDVCADGSFEEGFEKVALYVDDLGRYTHAARQTPDGRWTSKLGRGEDIAHADPDDVAGGVYGSIAGFMKHATDGA